MDIHLKESLVKSYVHSLARFRPTDSNSESQVKRYVRRTCTT